MAFRKITHREQRIVVTKLVMDLLKISYVYRDNCDLWGRHTDEMLVAYALLSGTLQGKYIGVQKVANVTGLPKATVHRRIVDLVACGAAEKSPSGKGFIVNVELLNNQTTTKALSQICHAIAKAGSELSKMEPLPPS